VRYERLAEDLSSIIAAGNLRPGERLPSVRRLSRERRAVGVDGAAGICISSKIAASSRRGRSRAISSAMRPAHARSRTPLDPGGSRYRSMSASA
jgi:DNA-binding transcriptional MocR family regulator